MPAASPPESTREPSNPSAPQPASVTGPAGSKALSFLTLPAMIEHIQGHGSRITEQALTSEHLAFGEYPGTGRDGPGPPSLRPRERGASPGSGVRLPPRPWRAPPFFWER